jgi:hypothetical protein
VIRISKKHPNLKSNLEQKTGPAHHLRILDPLLPLFGHPVERRPGTNNEHRHRPRSGKRTQPNQTPDLNWSSSLLRLLRDLRPPLKPNHDPPKPPRLDEPHRDQRRSNRKLSRRHESSLELLVRQPYQPLILCHNVYLTKT